MGGTRRCGWEEVWIRGRGSLRDFIPRGPAVLHGVATGEPNDGWVYRSSDDLTSDALNELFHGTLGLSPGTVAALFIHG